MTRRKKRKNDFYVYGLKGATVNSLNLLAERSTSKSSLQLKVK